MQNVQLYRRSEKPAYAYPPESMPAGRPFIAWPLLRITMGAIFFWAFLDKLFGLGFATTASKSWLHGGSPTRGFLSFGTQGPFADFFQGIAGHPLTDGLFMLGLAAVGLSLLVGVGVRIAGYSGALMVALMWLAHLPPDNHPFLDDHVVYAIILLALPTVRAGASLGLGRRWAALPIVRRFPILE